MLTPKPGNLPCYTKWLHFARNPFDAQRDQNLFRQGSQEIMLEETCSEIQLSASENT